jgi:hypothetical protein
MGEESILYRTFHVGDVVHRLCQTYGGPGSPTVKRSLVGGMSMLVGDVTGAGNQGQVVLDVGGGRLAQDPEEQRGRTRGKGSDEIPP